MAARKDSSDRPRAAPSKVEGTSHAGFDVRKPMCAMAKSCREMNEADQPATATATTRTIARVARPLSRIASRSRTGSDAVEVEVGEGVIAHLRRCTGPSRTE